MNRSALVVTQPVARLSRPDALNLLTETDDAPARAAAAKVARLRAKLAQARALVDVDRPSLESLADFEERTLPSIRDTPRRARLRELPAAVVEVASSDAQACWEAASIADRRAILDTLIEVMICPYSCGSPRSIPTV